MRKILLYITTAILLIAKYIQMAGYSINYDTNMWVLFLTIISGSLLVFLGTKLSEGKWRASIIIISILSILFIVAWYLYLNPWLDFAWSLLIFTSLFLAFYKASHYEIKKFASFSYAFMIIYILTESISIWRNDIYPPFFFIFLTFIVPMYFVGIKRVRE